MYLYFGAYEVFFCFADGRGKDQKVCVGADSRVPIDVSLIRIFEFAYGTISNLIFRVGSSSFPGYVPVCFTSYVIFHTGLFYVVRNHQHAKHRSIRSGSFSVLDSHCTIFPQSNPRAFYYIVERP